MPPCLCLLYRAKGAKRTHVWKGSGAVGFASFGDPLSLYLGGFVFLKKVVSKLETDGGMVWSSRRRQNV
jgi:hypothetical protein